MQTEAKPFLMGVIGAGKMGQALAGGFEKSPLAPNQIVHYDLNATVSQYFSNLIPRSKALKTSKDVIKVSNVILLAVKPQDIAQVAAEIKNQNKVDKLFISILAGIPLEALYAHLNTQRVVRVMPNTPCLIGQGVSAYSLGLGATEEDGLLVGQLLQTVGISFKVEEKDLDTVTAVSGSGPAYFYLFIEALTDAGVNKGLSREVAHSLAVQTCIGAGLLIKETGKDPAVLRKEVTSPGGTTFEALRVFESSGIRETFIKAIAAATKRSKELGEDSMSKLNPKN